jgi:thiamine kinase-like enzyme
VFFSFLVSLSSFVVNIDANRVPNYSSSGIDFLKMTLESQWIQETLEKMKTSLLESSHEDLSDFMKGKRFAFENVLCHNDVLNGNVLLEPTADGEIDDNPKITLIDYEYSGYNYRAFDIANHFCGWI